MQTTSGRQQVVRLMGESVRKTESPTLIDTFAQRTAHRLAVAADAIRQEFKKIPTAKSARAEGDDESFDAAAESESPRPSPQEFWLLKLLLLHDNLAGWASLHLDVNWISHPLARQIVERRLAAQANETWKGPTAFLNECELPEMRSLVTEAVAEDRKIPNPETQMTDVVLKLRNQFLDRQIAVLNQKVNQPEAGEAERIGFLREQQKLREKKRAPLSPPAFAGDS